MLKCIVKFNHNNISPLDNRYSSKIPDTRNIFSEHSLIRHRFIIEIRWIAFLCTNYPKTFLRISKSALNKLDNLCRIFDDKTVIKIKNIEKKTNHDVKAVEYHIKDVFNKDNILKKYTHLIHFGLTSEDINSLSYAIMINEGIDNNLKQITALNKLIKKLSNKWKNIPFLARTHGQPASPSTIGKEFKVFSSRIEREVELMSKIKPLAKFSGATGNFHTFHLVNEKIDWIKANKKFIQSFNVNQNTLTTQIEPHDWIAETMHVMTRINNILIDLSNDIWMYISNDVFKLKTFKNEVGSSTMPHKVNPIDFENAEGNFQLSNVLNNFFANKLTISRLQRDLSDSTVLRNIGVTFGHMNLGLLSVTKGLNKIIPNDIHTNKELNDNWEVLTEAVQTIMRYEKIDNAYEQLKALSRGNKVTKNDYIEFIESLNISIESKNKLLKLTPHQYIGLAKSL